MPFLQWAFFVPGSDGTYSQNYQDTWVATVAQHNGWGEGSFFVDVGAYSGIWCSNTRLLEHHHGWTGACVEPYPAQFEERSCKLFKNAMSNTDGQIVNFGGSLQGRQITSVGKGEGDRSESKQSKKAASLQSNERETLSFPTLLQESGAPPFVAFISLDIEGHELIALSAFPWDKHEVGVWIIEDKNRHHIGDGHTIKALLESKGYIWRPVEAAGVDSYFVKDKFWDSSFLKKDVRKHPVMSSGTLFTSGC